MEKTYEPLSVLAANDPVTCASHAKENGLSHINGWERSNHLANRDKHDLSSIASPKGERTVLSIGLVFSRVPHQPTLCFGEPTLGKLNKVKLFCSPTSSTLCDSTLAKLNQESEFCITRHIPLCDSDVHTGTTFSNQDLHLKHTKFPTDPPTK